MSTARILPPTADNLRLAAERLRAGSVVGMPTETVYGLAAVAFDEGAVAQVFAVKERPRFDPLIVHVADDANTRRDPLAALAAAGVVDDAVDGSGSIGRRAALLARALWPGPLTLVLPRGPAVPDLVTSGLDTVAVRMPRHPVAQALLSLCGFPLAAPSANRFGRISPTSAGDVRAELGDRIELILDGGPSEIGLESTVLALPAEGAPLLLRAGGVPREAIEALLGPVVVAAAEREDGDARLLESPGLLASHYAPRRPLRLLPGPVEACDAEWFRSAGAGPVGLLVQAGSATEVEAREARRLAMPVVARSLSERGDAGEKARRLFRALRELDASGAVALFAEPCPDETGLAHAVADRLRRASAPRPG